MEASLQIDVVTLDPPHRRALEDVVGRQLAANQRLHISVTEIEPRRTEESRPAQSLADWTKVYDGLSDADIASIDQIAKTRANMSRDLP